MGDYVIKGRWTATDPDLGACVVFRGSRGYVAFFTISALVWGALLVGAIVETALGTARGPASGIFGLAILAAFTSMCAVGQSRTQMVVGERGFRYVRPFRRVSAGWSEVLAVQAGPRRASAAMVVSLSGDRGKSANSIRIKSAFSASAVDICREMDRRRFEAGRPAGLSPGSIPRDGGK